MTGSSKPGKYEKDVQNDILLNLPENVVLFRNNVGMLNGVKFGLANGSSDLIGWATINGVAVFLAIEVKRSEKSPVSAEQKNFIRVVQESGGIAGIAKSPDDVKKIIDEFKQEK